MILSKVDQRLLTAAVSEKRSAKALSEAVNGFLTPEQALLRLKELLSDSNPLSDLEERRLLVLDARRVMGLLNENVEAGDVRAMETYRKYLTTVADRLDKAMVNVDLISTKLTTAYAQIMADSVLAAFEAMPKALEERGLVLDMEEVHGVFQEIAPLAASRIEANSSDE